MSDPTDRMLDIGLQELAGRSRVPDVRDLVHEQIRELTTTARSPRRRLILIGTVLAAATALLSDPPSWSE